MKNITIIIPAFNEERSVGSVVEQLLLRCPEAELLVIDDGSTDKTAEIAESAGASVIRHERNYGYGSALKTGVLASNQEYVLFCDADGQHSVEDIERIMAARENCEMVVGARDINSYTPFNRMPGKFLLRKFADYLAGQHLPDMNSGLRLIKREVLLKYLHLMPASFSFSTTTTFALLKGNHCIKWIPITVKKRIGSSTVRQWKHGPETIMLMLRLTVLFEPLKVFLKVAQGLFIFSVISLLLDVLHGIDNGIGDVTVLLSIATLLVFMVGLLCDQVSALRRELHEYYK